MFSVKLKDEHKYVLLGNRYETYAEANSYLHDLVIYHDYDPEELEIVKVPQEK